MDTAQGLPLDLAEAVVLVLGQEPTGQAQPGEVLAEEAVEPTRCRVGEDDLAGGVGGQGRLVQAVEVIQVTDPRRNSGDRHSTIMSEQVPPDGVSRTGVLRPQAGGVFGSNAAAASPPRPITAEHDHRERRTRAPASP